MRGFSFARSGARWGQQVFRYHNSRYSLMLPECWLKRTSTWPEVNDRPVFTWRATLHIEVFLPAQVPDSELDQWMESRIYPAMTAIPALAGLITTMVTQGYEYRRDDDMALWSSADLTYSITYEM